MRRTRVRVAPRRPAPPAPLRAPARLAPPPPAIRPRRPRQAAVAAGLPTFPLTTIDGVPCFLLGCPHCDDGATIAVAHNEINCKIFRHGKYLKSGRQIPPHTGQAECERLVREKLIDGCGKPFYFDGHKLDGTIGYI